MWCAIVEFPFSVSGNSLSAASMHKYNCMKQQRHVPFRLPCCCTELKEVGGLFMLVFENTNKIKHAFRQMVQQYGEEILDNKDQFVSIMNDTIPEFEKERRLFRTVLGQNLLMTMRREDSRKIAIMKAREYMTNELFLADSAVEFVLVCFTFMMDWDYESPAPQEVQAAAAAIPAAAAPSISPNSIPKAAAPAKPAAPVSAQRIYDSKMAARSRWKNTIKIDDGYTTLDAFCFDGFGFLKNIQLPPSLIVIGEFSFSECKRLKTIDLPPHIKRIGKGAFQSCSRLTMLRIPEGVTEIEDNTFAFCQGLEVLELPRNLASIGAEAFQSCVSLKSLFLPASVKYIEENAFEMCPNLTIGCYENTYAHKFCQANGIRCKVLRERFGI